MRCRLAVIAALSLCVTACGGGSGVRDEPPVPAAATAAALARARQAAAVRDPLPGTPVRVAAPGFPIDPSSVRRVLVTGSGAQTVPLYVARGLGGELCVGTSGIFKCLTGPVVEPVYALTVFGGRRGSTEWGAVVGLARPDVKVALELQSGGAQPVTLPATAFPGLGWSAFASTVYHGNGNFPDSLHYTDGQGRTLSGFLDLAYLWSPCTNRPARCPAAWRVGGDPLTLALGRQELGPRVRMLERAEAIAVADPLVARLLRGRRISVFSRSPWFKQQGGLIGAGFQIHLSPPASFEEDWPLQGCDPHAAYTRGVVHFAVTDVSELDVDVDVRSREVVGVDPTNSGSGDPEPSVDRSSYRVVARPRPAGGSDHGDCGGPGD